MAVIGQSHLSLGSRVPDYSYLSYTIVRIVPTHLAQSVVMGGQIIIT